MDIHKWAVPFGLNNIDALVLGKNISTLCFVGSHWDELHMWKGSSFFSTGNEKWIVLIGMHNIDGLVSRKEHFNPSFCWVALG